MPFEAFVVLLEAPKALTLITFTFAGTVKSCAAKVFVFGVLLTSFEMYLTVSVRRGITAEVTTEGKLVAATLETFKYVAATR